MTTLDDDLVVRLRKRAEIRRQIPSRKSVQEGQPDRISDLLEEAADEIDRLNFMLDEVRIKCMIQEADESYTKFDLIDSLAAILKEE